MLTLVTRPELENRLQTEAQKRGLKAEDYAVELLESLLAPAKMERSEAERLAAIDELAGFGKEFASLRLSDQIRRDRNEDSERDERDFQEHFGRRK